MSEGTFSDVQHIFIKYPSALPMKWEEGHAQTAQNEQDDLSQLLFIQSSLCKIQLTFFVFFHRKKKCSLHLL